MLTVVDSVAFNGNSVFQVGSANGTVAHNGTTEAPDYYLTRGTTMNFALALLLATKTRRPYFDVGSGSGDVESLFDRTRLNSLATPSQAFVQAM